MLAPSIKNFNEPAPGGTRLLKRHFEEGYHDHFLYREAENSQRNRARLRMLLQQKHGGHLLEIGCGKGGFLRLAEDHFQVEGMDISSHAIESIRPHFGERVSVANLATDPLPANCFDVVVVFNILEHLDQPGLAIHKIACAVKQDGLVIGSVPNNFGLVGGLVTRIGNFIDRTHVATYAPHTWRMLFTQAGFAQTDFFGEVPMGRNHCTYLRHKLWPYFSLNLMFVCHPSQRDR